MKNNEFLSAALKYRDLGLSVIPITPKDKSPLIEWKEFQKRKASVEEIEDWWKQWPDANVGIVTGKISDIVVVDVDTRDPLTGYPLPATAISETTKGNHFIYRYPKEGLGNKAGIISNVDIRGDGGYIVAPPSVHPSGTEYKWVTPIEDHDLNDLPSWVLEKTKVEEKQSLDISKPVPIGERNDTATRVLGAMIAKNREALFYPLLCELKEWNEQKCSPPLPESELLAIYESITSREIDSTERDLEKHQVIDLSLPISAKELCEKDTPDITWIVDHLVEARTITMISAAPNNWKTWVAMEIAFQVATGGDVFDHFETTQQGVLIVNEEDPESMVQNRCRKLLGDRKLENVFFHIAKGIKLDSSMTDKLIEQMKQLDLSVVIFDSLSVVHTGQENDASEMQNVMDQMKKFTREGFAVIFTHHHRKKPTNRGYKEDPQQQSRGSSVINAVPSCHLTCEEVTDHELNKFIVITQVKLKGDQKLEAFQVKVEIEGDKINLIHAGAAVERGATIQVVKEKIIEILNFEKRWMSRNDFLDAEVAGMTPIREALKELVAANAVEKVSAKDLCEKGVFNKKDKVRSNKLFYNLPGVLDPDVEQSEILVRPSPPTTVVKQPGFHA